MSGFHIDGYRSLLDVDVTLARLTVVQGENGTGKSNLYRALGLAVAAARGTLAAELASEGGFPSALWAGPRTGPHAKGPKRIRIAINWDDLRYRIELGRPQTIGEDPFPNDPEVKLETIEVSDGRRWLTMAERGNASAFIRDDEGNRRTFPFELWRGESMLAQISDPRSFPIPADVRDRLLSWRRYHQFRTDHQSPIRESRVGVRTPQLDEAGHELAAALATIWWSGSGDDLDRHVAAAFPGCRVRHMTDDSGRFGLLFETPDLQRPLTAPELSDGTLRYLCLLAALLSPQPPTLMAFNEPETSLHPSLEAPLADLLIEAADRSQIWVTTHSETLADRVAAAAGAVLVHQVDLRGGATTLSAIR